MVLRTDVYDNRDFCSARPERKRWSVKPTHTSFIAWHILALAYYCCSYLPNCAAQSTSQVRLVDLTHTFDESTIYWVNAKPLNFTVTHNGTDPGKKYWYQADEIAAGTHGGTHMDAPCHFGLGRWCISDVPIERLTVVASTIDISSYVGNNPNFHLSLEHVRDWEKAHGRIPDGSLLLVRTGWSKFWPDPLTYSGTTERNAELLKFPSIKPEVAKWLVSNRDVVGVGVDVMSTDIPGGNTEVHTLLADKNIYGLENVNMMEALPPTGVKVYVMPMKVRGASGAPCRILAEVPEGMTNGNVGTSYSFSLMWTTVMAIVWTLKF